MEELTLWVIGRVKSFPRDHRFTLGDRLIESCLVVLDALVEAQPDYSVLDERFDCRPSAGGADG